MLSSTSTSDHIAVTDTSATSVALTAGTLYRVVCTVDSYIAMNSATPTASAADDNHIVMAYTPFYFLNLVAGHKVALIRIGAANGAATVSVASHVSGS